MSKTQFIIRSLQRYWRQHLLLAAGFGLTAMVLVGAAAVGDSVRSSLRQITHHRLGAVEYAVNSHRYLFDRSLAERLGRRLKAPVTACYQTHAVASAPLYQTTAFNVQITGVQENFWSFWKGDSAVVRPSGNNVLINRRLAGHLGVNPGDVLNLRVQRVSSVPAEAPMASEKNEVEVLSVTVRDVIDQTGFGNFGLEISQIPPLNLFIELEYLTTELGIRGKSNLLLLSGDTLEIRQISPALHQSLSLSDLQLRFVRSDSTAHPLLLSERVFMEEWIIEGLENDGIPVSPVYTYLVNEIRHGENATPYSFVTGVDSDFLGPDWDDPGIFISTWLADDLQAAENDTLSVDFYSWDINDSMSVKSTLFQVDEVQPLTHLLFDAALMPEYPGLHGMESCSEWDPGVEINLDAVRPKDEEYWEIYRGTPKALISYSRARELWQNAYGSMTGILLSDPVPNPDRLIESIIHSRSPEQLGFDISRPLEEGLAAGRDAVDFGELFMGLSFFIIASCLILIGLIFRLHLMQRREEAGTLTALGFPARTITFLRAAEFGLTVPAGILIGTAGGILYNRLLIYSLNQFWTGAVGVRTLISSNSVLTVGGAALTAALVTAVVLGLSGRSVARHDAVSLQSGTPGAGKILSPMFIESVWKTSTVLLILAVGMAFWGRITGFSQFSLFLVSGILVIPGWLGLILGLMHRFMKNGKDFSAGQLVQAGMTRNAGRTLTSICLMMIGIFLILSVSLNRQVPGFSGDTRNSGTGGFDLVCQTVFPVIQDVSSPEGRKQLKLDQEALTEIEWIPFMLKEGDDASCLNLNRIQNPRLLGVETHHLARRNAFSFTRQLDTEKSDGWNILDLEPGPNLIPAIADETVIVWGFGLSVGDTLTVSASDGGQYGLVFYAGLTPSVFQGHIIISESNLRKLYPEIEGYRFFLMDCEDGCTDDMTTRITRRMHPYGWEMMNAKVKLAGFQTVTNTYLDIFLALGGLGLILGTAAFAVLVFRSMAERKTELALCQAVGFTRRRIAVILFSEHFLILLLGIFGGLLSSGLLMAGFPQRVPGSAMILAGGILTAVILNGAFWIWISSRAALRTQLLNALRNE